MTCTHASRKIVREHWLLTVRWVNVAPCNHKSENETCRGVVLECTQALSPDLWRPRHSVSETHIYFHRVFVINHNAAPRTSCFLRHLLFDKLKLTDTAERFITFSQLVCCMLSNPHCILLCVSKSWRIFISNHYVWKNLISYHTVSERIQPSFAFIMLFFIRMPNYCLFVNKQIRPSQDFSGISIIGKAELIYFDAIPKSSFLLCKWIKLMHLSPPCRWTLFISHSITISLIGCQIPISLDFLSLTSLSTSYRIRFS